MDFSALINKTCMSTLINFVGMLSLSIATTVAASEQPEKQQTTQVAAATVDDFDELPAGYHRMADGTVMANSPSTAVAPEGYHLMPDGTLMANGSNMSKHASHGGMWMSDYQSTQMYMGGLLDTTTKVSGEEVVASGSVYSTGRGYTMAPVDMTMQMHMFMAMYHSSRYMAMLMFHYMKNDMTMVTASGQKGAMSTSGMGDSVATVEFPLKSLHAKYSLGLSIPTGSITESGPMPGMPNAGDVRYPYGMQLGSGTYDVLFDAGIERRRHKLTYAANYHYTLRTGENSEGYTLGNKYSLDGLMRYHFSSTINADVQLSFLEVGQIDGRDNNLLCNESSCMSPAADYLNTGGRRADFKMGVKYENSHMTSFAFEFAQPIYQNLIGPQMRTDWITSFKFGYMF